MVRAFGLINLPGESDSTPWSYRVILSRTTRSVLDKPLRQTFASNSPTVLTRRLPKWSMSSIPISKNLPASSRAFSSLDLPRLKSVSFRVAATKSSTVVTRTSNGVSKFNFRLSMCLPTLAKS